MNILGIDPGSYCGWAFRTQIDRSHGFISGVWSLKGGRFDGYGMRFIRLRNFLDEFLKGSKPDLVAFEEVKRHLGTDAAHIYGGVVAVLTAWCEEHKLPYQAIPVGTIKKFATGKGNADKSKMLAAASREWPLHPFEDDNEADARFIAACAASEFARDFKVVTPPNTQQPNLIAV